MKPWNMEENMWHNKRSVTNKKKERLLLGEIPSFQVMRSGCWSDSAADGKI